MKSIATLLLLIPTAQAAFIPSGVPVAWGSGTKLGFGFPSGFGGSKADDNKADAEENAPEKKISAGGLVQLITAGMGAPFLGDFEGVDEETGKFMFSLEANNLVDEKGESKQTQMPYFENGWVDESEPTEGGGFKFPWQK
ncbi:predicted protein [Thalassiosira pseudonana CCMP1335]|uniref:Uncharacterized protein n=1 Tax=Thalassiosira pseudonana TaxID=35128 RepID=B8BXE1_THAPS|nr:predicted protein [Thalassiosira pseudonana CCMP1335]EED94191.1 predicted protein [Thalassiosira pseudonana CCMP1335]|eukprot:g3410.t1 g3410   contig12:2012736-2013266(+)